jgi:transcriptional regulator with XRE-family HTH domain
VGAVHRRADLAEFLRARRQALEPATVGLPAGRRRTPGVRREELAMLAGVSVSWYTWLEQGRPINASVDVLDALARTLRLDPVERDHLLALAGHPLRGPLGAGHDAAPPALVTLLDALEPAPAYVLGPRWDVLAWNAAYERLFPPVATVPAGERNLVWFVFANADARDLIDDWETEARRVLSQFRADTTPYRDDPAVVDLVHRLQAASATFASWWPRHDVAGFERRERRFDHPSAGPLRFGYQHLVPAGEPDLRVVVLLPIADDDSAERLHSSSSAAPEHGDCRRPAPNTATDDRLRPA